MVARARRKSGSAWHREHASLRDLTTRRQVKTASNGTGPQDHAIGIPQIDQVVTTVGDGECRKVVGRFSQRNRIGTRVKTGGAGNRERGRRLTDCAGSGEGEITCALRYAGKVERTSVGDSHIA